MQLFGPAPGFISGLWLILIGWFLNTSAESSYQDLVVRQLLEGSRVREVMTLNPETVSSKLTLQELMDQYFFNRSYQSFPIIETDQPIGLVTLNEVKQAPQEQWNSLTVRDIMTPIEQGIAISPHEDISNVLTKMQEAKKRRLLVVQDGHLEGILSVTDLANWLQRRREFGDSVPQRSASINQLKDTQPV